MKLPLAALAAALLVACVPTLPSPDEDGERRTRAVHVVSNGWHTAIVVPRQAVAATGLVPEAADFAGAAYLEFGWGDREYYPARRTTIGMTLRAALTPTPAVMHVAGRARLPEPGDGRETIRVALSETGLRDLARAISGAFDRPEGGRARPVAAGLYAHSHFYPARGSFHLFNTCNTWTARMLRAGGVGLSPSGVVTADDLMTRLRAAPGAEAVPAPAPR